MAECGVDGHCRTLWGGDDSTVFKHHNGPVGHGEQAATASQAPNGPVGHGEQVRQPPLIQGSEPGPLKEKLQMESTSTGRPQTLEGQRLVTMVGVVSMVRMVRMVGEVESVAHL